MNWLEIGEGELVFRADSDPKFKQMRQQVVALQDALKQEQAAHGETKRILSIAEERVSRLIGELTLHGKKEAKRLRANERRRKPPQEGKRQFSPEAMENLRATAAKAREQRRLDYLARQAAAKRTEEPTPSSQKCSEENDAELTD